MKETKETKDEWKQKRMYGQYVREKEELGSGLQKEI